MVQVEPLEATDHEPAAICDSSGGVVRNGRSRGLGRRLACWLRFGRDREHRRSANRGPPRTISHADAEVADAPQATAMSNAAVANDDVAAAADR